MERILSPGVSKFIMLGQSGIPLGKETGSILPSSLLVLVHSSVHSGATAGAEPCAAVQSGRQLCQAVESGSPGFKSGLLLWVIVKLDYLISLSSGFLTCMIRKQVSPRAI